MAKEDIIFAGGGSKCPSLMMWSNPVNEAKPLVISQFPQKYSVYALAISPNGTRIAAGTRKGLLRVYNLTDFQVSENAPVLFEVFHPPAVTSLTFCTDNILVSGGLDGNIKVWSVSKEKHGIEEFSAHSDGVFALRQIGPLVLASIGGDGVLRIWDMDSFENKYESDSFALPGIRALTSLDYNSNTGLLIHPSLSGNLHIYNVRDNFKKRLIPAHEGDFGALAYSNDYMVTAGSQDRVIKLWSSSMDNLITETTAPGGIIAVGWSGTKTIMTIFADGRGQFWNINNGNLLLGLQTVNFDLRTTAGLPVEITASYHTTAERQWRDKKLAKAKELIGQPGKQKELTLIVNELSQHGFLIEGTLVLADAARSQGKLLWELESRLVLAEELGDSKAAIPSLYALGELLQNIREPQLAQFYFKNILQIDENYMDVKERIAQSELDPLMHLCPDKDVRGDLMSNDLVLQELEKYTILKKKFSWRVVFDIGQTRFFDYRADVQELAKSVSDAISEHGAKTSSAGLKQIKFLCDGELRDISWMYLPSTIENFGITFALEINLTATETELTPYKIFDPTLLGISATASPQEHNQLIRDAWLKVLKSSKSKKWWQKAYKMAIKDAKQFVEKRLLDLDPF